LAHPITLSATLALPQRWAATLAIAAIMAAVVAVSLQRTHFGIAAESDFTSTFGPEAQRVLAGEPLKLVYHPPGYAFTLAAARLLAGEWLAAGLWVSGLSALVLLVASFATCRRLAGTAAAFGALAACACSSVFFTSASFAASDMLFAALVYSTLALAVTAWQEPGRTAAWIGTGLLAALVLLERANGVAALAVFIVPLLAGGTARERTRNFALLTAAFLVPVLAWLAYASATGSPLWSVRNYMNLAVAAFADESKPWGDLADAMESQFRNFGDVLRYDPARMASRFADRLLSLPRKIARTLTWLPLIVLALPGLLLVWWRQRTLPFLFTLLVLTGLTFLTGIVEFEARFHIVLIPFIGAMAGAAAGYVLESLGENRAIRLAACAALAAVIAVAAAYTHRPVLPRLEWALQREIGEAIPYVNRTVEPDAIIFARKFNLGFETGRETKVVLNVPSVAVLRAKLCAELEPGRAGYLYFGLMERRYLGELHAEMTEAGPIPWLEPVARGRQLEWTLYRIHPAASATAASCSSSSTT
jgi:hypothetical protein